MIETAAPGLRWRTAVAVVLAYAMMLHGVLAGAPSTLRGGSTGLGSYVCGAMTGVRDAHPGVPEESRHDHAACALCGLGHCGMALPDGSARPQAPNYYAAADMRAMVPGPVPQARRPIAAGPRGPPNQG